MQITSEQRHDDGVLERAFTLGETPGTLWTPGENVGSGPLPLVLMSHNNGLPMADPRLTARARYTAARGYAVATVDAADCGDRPRTAAHERARADLRRAMEAGEPVDELFESLVGPMVENAVPEWLAVLDALLALPGIHGPVGYSGGWAALGIGLASVEPRIVAAGFFAGGYVPRAQREEARRLTIPLLFLLQWDDTGEPAAAGPGPVRLLRRRAEDAARQCGRTHRHSVVRAGGRVPVPGPPPEGGRGPGLRTREGVGPDRFPARPHTSLPLRAGSGLPDGAGPNRLAENRPLSGRLPTDPPPGAGQEPPRGKETSTRRFFFRPSSSLLLAIGYCSP